jgi:2-oxoisovalerate dehydrogenase E1 component beta subunit
VNQLIGEAARVSYGTNGALRVPVVIRVPYGGGIRGGLFHSQNVEAYFFHTPGLKVVAPSTPYDAKGLLKSAIRDNNPVVFLEHKKTYRLVRGEVPEEDYTIPLGVADVKRAGRNITVVSYGLMLHYCLEAAEQVAIDGIDVEVVDLRTLKPLDKETVLESVKKTGKLLIVHEDNITGGVGAEVAALVADEAFEYLDGPITRLCGPDVPTMPFAQSLEDAYMPTTERIAEALRKQSAY